MKHLYLCLITAMSLFVFVSCDNCIDGDGAKVTQTINVADFDGIDLQMSGDVNLTDGDQQVVEIVASQRVIDEIVKDSEVVNGIWEIDLDGCYRNLDVVINITNPQFSKIELTGSGDINSTNTLSMTENTEIDVSGSGDLDLSLKGMDEINADVSGSGNVDLSFGEIDKMRIDLSGSGDFEASGFAKDQEIVSSGSGDIDNFNLDSKDCTIESSGSGNIAVRVEDFLSVEVTGSGNVCYKGNPNVISDVTGSGDLLDCN